MLQRTNIMMNFKTTDMCEYVEIGHHMAYTCMSHVGCECRTQPDMSHVGCEYARHHIIMHINGNRLQLGIQF